MKWTLVTLDSGESAEIPVWLDFDDDYYMVYTDCMSRRCPGFITVNEENNLVRVDGTKTRSKYAKGMYMLSFEFYDRQAVLDFLAGKDIWEGLMHK